MTRGQALELLAALPPCCPSDYSCSAVNPALWAAWCGINGRDGYHSDIWTETDVVDSAVLMLAKHLNAITIPPEPIK